ncbi:hypothetical protein J6590_079100 [Homalodisca vitripennis]|nr:hypothetical protein J6590_079100 [Homalodisca vitripennis]
MRRAAKRIFTLEIADKCVIFHINKGLGSEEIQNHAGVRLDTTCASENRVPNSYPGYSLAPGRSTVCTGMFCTAPRHPTASTRLRVGTRPGNCRHSTRVARVPPSHRVTRLPNNTDAVGGGVPPVPSSTWQDHGVFGGWGSTPVCPHSRELHKLIYNELSMMIRAHFAVGPLREQVPPISAPDGKQI